MSQNSRRSRREGTENLIRGFGGRNCPLNLNSSLVVSSLLLVMGVDEPNKLGRDRQIGYNRRSVLQFLISNYNSVLISN